MTTKLTNKMAIQYAIATIEGKEVSKDFSPEDVVEKLNTMILQLDKKNASPKKLTNQQMKNEEIKTALYNFLAGNAPNGYTVSDLINAVPEVDGDSNQHVSALLRMLVIAGDIEKYTEKRRTYFRVPSIDDKEEVNG